MSETPSNSDQYTIRYEAFNNQADRYERWFDGDKGHYIFRIEVECLKTLTYGLSRPWLEVGVGTGRFAEALGIEYGIDPAEECLKYAVKRGISVKRGFAEHMPYPAESFGAVFMIVTLCFLTDPGRVFQECVRVLTWKGSLVIGLVPKDSPWGRMYAEKGRKGNPFYSPATFYTSTDVVDMARRHGFELNQAQSCLLEGPDNNPTKPGEPKKGIIPEAGFVGMRFTLES